MVLIVMDTTRQDRLSIDGYERDTSPNLAELAAESTTYSRAYSPGGWTPSAHASLFTGLFPIGHQVTQENWRMGDHLTTLAEVFSEKGYETIGITENPMLNPRLNFEQGFSNYYEAWRESGGAENGAFHYFKESLDKRKKNRPFFMFVNLIEPHSPYNSSRQFYYEFVSDRSMKIEENMWPKFYSGEKIFTEKEIRHLNELYDAELLYTDYIVGGMAEELKSRGLWEDTVFIVTSDHGENIGDHGMMDHVCSLNESIIRIPLLIYYPKHFSPGIRHDYPVQLTDIFPTLLEIAGIDPARYPSQGESLIDRAPDDIAPVLSEYYYPEQVLEGMNRKGLIKRDGKEIPIDRHKRRIRALIIKDMKLIWGSNGRHELYDLAKDPGEKNNLIDAAEYSETSRELLAMLDSMISKYDLKMGKARSVDKEELDKETLEKLKSLGYIQ